MPSQRSMFLILRREAYQVEPKLINDSPDGSRSLSIILKWSLKPEGKWSPSEKDVLSCWRQKIPNAWTNLFASNEWSPAQILENEY